ncbi:MAG: hypothetical protein M3Z46_04985 [Actinomycetota bacterium]|nr:hypothetical protein [Actinomycetota bacterium]
MELNELLRILRRHWYVSLAVLALVAFLGIQSAYSQQDSYLTAATMIVEPKAGGVQDVQFLLPGFAARLESRRIRQDAFRKQFTPFTQFLVGSNLPVTIRAGVDSGSNVLRVSAEGPHAGALAALANAVSQELIDEQPADSPAKISFLDTALTPGSPENKDHNPMIYGSVALGAILGLFAAIGMEFLRRRLDGANEIRRRFGTSIVAEIPSFRRFRRPATSPRELLENGADPRVVEAFHRLRTNVQIALRANDAARFAVVSAGARDGKSTVAASLGWVLASAGTPVMLIDANLRHPMLHKQLEQRAGPGLSNLVADGNEQIARPTVLSSLSLVTAGSPERHPADIVRESLPQLLQRFDGSGQLVIVDSPSLRGAAETTVIASEVGFVLLVVNARRFDPDEIERALRELHDANSKVLGVVVNRSRRVRGRRTATPFHQPKSDEGSGGRFRLGRRDKSKKAIGSGRTEPVLEGVASSGPSTGD